MLTLATGLLLVFADVPAGFAQPGIGAAPGNAAPHRRGRALVQSGAITDLDSATMSFGLSGNGSVRRFWVGRSTIFAGRPGASFFQLKSGDRVRVQFHSSGADNIADAVSF